MLESKYRDDGNGRYWDGTPEEQAEFDTWWAKEQIPKTISQRQCRLYLLGIDLLDNVDAAITSMSRAAQIEWEFGSYVARDNPLVLGMQQMFTWTDVQMDTMFVEASLL